MAELLNYTRNDLISRYVQMESTSEPSRIVNYAIDGTAYVQIIGSPAVRYTAEVYVYRQGKAKLELADRNGDVLKLTVKHGIYYGRISEINFDRLSVDAFKATLTLAKEDVV